MNKLKKFVKSLIFGGEKEDVRDVLLKQMPSGSVCAEIGVFKGDFSVKIIKMTSPQRLHLIDPYKYQTDTTYKGSWYGGNKGVDQAYMDGIHQSVLTRFQTEIAAGTVRVERASSDEASARFTDNYFDWVYIDGNHLYEFVKSDLEHYFPKVKSGGYITGDDYDVVGWWDNGVKKAVDEFVANHPVELLWAKNGQFCIRKK